MSLNDDFSFVKMYIYGSYLYTGVFSTHKKIWSIKVLWMMVYSFE